VSQPVAPQPSKELKTSSKSFKDSLGGLTGSEKLKVLLRVPRSEEEKTSCVEVLTVSLPLSKKAQAQPLVAWKQAILELTGHQPLLVSLIHPCRAEVYMDLKVSTTVKETLRGLGYLQDPLQLDERDLVRRKRAYLSGYFLLLRRAALQGLESNRQLELLQMVEAELSPEKYPDQSTRKQWMFQVKKDREWVQRMMTVE
jgi:hypothetical protein